MWCLLGTNCFSRLATVRVPITDSRILSYRPRIGTAASATTTATGNRKRLRARSPFRPVVQRLGNTGDFYPTVRPSLNLRHFPRCYPNVLRCERRFVESRSASSIAISSSTNSMILEHPKDLVSELNSKVNSRSKDAANVAKKKYRSI